MKLVCIAVCFLSILPLRADTLDDYVIKHLASTLVVRFLPSNERSSLVAVRIYSPNWEPFIVSSPLTVHVLALDAKGIELKPLPSGGFGISWQSDVSEDSEVKGWGVVIEIPIGTYEGGGEIGSFPTVVKRYDLNAINSVKITFSVKIRNKAAGVFAIIPGDEVRRLVKQKGGE